jgi:hypothetical protein
MIVSKEAVPFQAIDVIGIVGAPAAQTDTPIEGQSVYQTCLALFPGVAPPPKRVKTGTDVRGRGLGQGWGEKVTHEH